MLTDFQNCFTVRISKKFATKCGNISRHTLNVYLNYFAKFKCSHIIIFNYSSHKHFASIWPVIARDHTVLPATLSPTIPSLLAFSLFHIIDLQCFCLFILWKLEINSCCVKCTRILLFLLFCIFQGRRVTYLRCSGKCCIRNVANFLLSSTLNEFLRDYG